MRLTLRTLLAYLDGILDPKDNEELSKKIEESEYATGLVHRLRDVLRRLRLGAPSLTDRGPGLDPNTVAEYLDNTLPAERVTDFEKVCLDSDIHLAEVGSCHQILTLVLGEPAEVDPASRQRMYEVRDVHSGAKPPPPLASSTALAMPTAMPSLNLGLEVGGEELTDRKPRPRPTVPEYLREPRRRRVWVSAAVVLVAACIIVMVLKAGGQFEPDTPLGKVLVRLGVVAAQPEVAQNDKKPAGENGGDAKGTPSTDQSAADNPDKPADGSAAQPAGKPSADPIKTAGPIVEPPAASKDGTRTKPSPDKSVNPDKSASADVKTPSKAVEPDNPAKTTETPVTPVAKPGDDPTKTLPDPPLPPEPVGKLPSADQVLLCNNPVNGWTRIAVNQALIPQHVLALPTYRAKVALTLGVTLEVIGGSRVELLGSTPQEMPGIRVLYGRVVLTPAGQAGIRLRVAFGDHSGTITFVDADSVAALDVENLYPPGANPEDVPPRVTANLFAASGAILWEEATKEKDKTPIRLAPPQRLGFDAMVTEKPVAGRAVPDWINGIDAIKYADRRASPIIAQALPTDQPARIKLLELTTLRPQKEVKSLALRCLGYVGQFNDMVAALNDPAHKTEWWDYYVPQLRAAVARDAETAAAVRMALEKQYPQQAAELYRMLLGYTDEQLKAGEDKALVRCLKNDESLAVRVLSYWNLRDITGRGEIFQPEQPAARRQPAVRRWEQRLEAKEIRVMAPPAGQKGRSIRDVIAPD